ncbi:MAG: hypothetical protein D6760_08960, partial [Deltaproteobacteria bacterium]
MADTIVPLVQIAVAIGIATFWLNWLRHEQNEPWFPPGFIEHERAFVYPDSICALLLVVSAILSLAGHPLGRSVGLVAGGMLLFLGVIDLAYMLQNGLLARERNGLQHFGIVASILAASAIV